jgi:hypothetical protein
MSSLKVRQAMNQIFQRYERYVRGARIRPVRPWQEGHRTSRRSRIRPNRVLGLLLAVAVVCQGAELRPETVAAFDQHVATSDARLQRHPSLTEPFLRTTSSPDRLLRLDNGEIVVDPCVGKGDLPVKDGIIHHWIGGVFVPGRGAAEALALLQDFDGYKRIYAASVDDSKTLKREGDSYRAYLRLRKHRVVTVVLNTEYQGEFVRVDGQRWYSRSHSTRIAQVKDPGGPGERELPVGDDSGYLWRIVTFWRLQETASGVYLECEVIGLTRGVPFGLGWLVRPIIRSFPRESLFETLSDTRNALLAKGAAPRMVSRADLPLSAIEPLP